MTAIEQDFQVVKEFFKKHFATDAYLAVGGVTDPLNADSCVLGLRRSDVGLSHCVRLRKGDG